MFVFFIQRLLVHAKVEVHQAKFVMVSPMIEVAVLVKRLVQSIKVTVIGAINAKETLSVVKTIVLHLFQSMLTAVNHLMVQVRKYKKCKF